METLFCGEELSLNGKVVLEKNKNDKDSSGNAKTTKSNTRLKKNKAVRRGRWHRNLKL